MSDQPSVSAASAQVVTEPALTEHERAVRIDRLIERLAMLQSDLGGLFYEMAIRDHLQLDLLVERAAAMQRVEEELHALQGTASPPKT